MLTENGTASADLAIPPTIHALLAARLDRLAPDERVVIERASVIGKEFWRTAVAELSSDPERAAVGASLMTLARKELDRACAVDLLLGGRVPVPAHPDSGRGVPRDPEGDEGRAPRAFRGLARGERRRAREGARRDHRLPPRAGVRLPRGAGARSQRARRLWRRARASGWRRRAAAQSRRGDTSAAASLISRAVKLLPSDHPSQAELLTELASRADAIGDFERAGEVIEEALRHGRAVGDRRLELRRQRSSASSSGSSPAKGSSSTAPRRSRRARSRCSSRPATTSGWPGRGG